MVSSIKHFIKKTLWEIDIDRLPTYKKYALLFLRIILLALFNFYERKTINYASSLTYYTALNLVPIIAVVFGLAKGFGLERLLEKQIMKIAENANWQPEITRYILDFSRNFLEQTKGGVIAGVGVVFLFWTIMAIIGKIEYSFNSIWGVKKERTFVRKFTDYMAIFIIAPILFAISNSITILVSTKIGLIMKNIGMEGIIIYTVKVLLEIISYGSLWVLLITLYIIIPNTKVPLKSALVGGIISGTVLYIIQWIYINFQIGVAKYGAIYGSLAALPLLFMWMNISWIVVLFGVEIAYAYENRETYGWIPPFSSLNVRTKKILLLSVFKMICKQYYELKRPLSTKEISTLIKAPLSIVKDIIEILISSKLVVEISEDNIHGLYQPARPLEGLTVEDVLNAYEKTGVILNEYKSDYLNEVKDLLEQIERMRKNFPENKEIKKIIG